MKRWLTHLLIASYLGALGFGIFSHAVNYKVGAHPAMYFIVWDMFCGWSSHASRLQIIGQDDKGDFYELAPGPWGEIKPYGDIGRRHYDAFGYFTPTMALNCLKQTKHEPMERIYIVEECWPKKYNLPDKVYARRHTDPKDSHHYFHMRYVLDGEGTILQRGDYWLNYQNALCISNNPRLMADSRKGRPFYNVSLQDARKHRAGFGEIENGTSRMKSANLLGGSSTN